MTLFDSPAFEGHEGVHAFTDEASGLIESEQVDVEREAPLEGNESVERSEPRDNPGPPAFED